MQLNNIILLISFYACIYQIHNYQCIDSYSYIIKYPNSDRGEFTAKYYILYSDSLKTFQDKIVVNKENSSRMLLQLGMNSLAKSYYEDNRFMEGCCDKGNDVYYLTEGLKIPWQYSIPNIDSILDHNKLWKVYNITNSYGLKSDLAIIKCKVKICKCKTGPLIESIGDEIVYVREISEIRKISWPDNYIAKKLITEINKFKY